MILTIIAEPRSGSTNLANWFNLQKSFTVLYEPISNPNTKWFKNNEPLNTWEYKTPNLLIKEVYNGQTDFTDLINFSDKIIVLYRENTKEQTESYINSKNTGNWGDSWSYNKNYDNEFDIQFFKTLKENFKELYIKDDSFTITYEDLYIRDEFEKIINFLNIDGVTNKNFPYGNRYRVNKKINSLI